MAGFWYFVCESASFGFFPYGTILQKQLAGHDKTDWSAIVSTMCSLLFGDVFWPNAKRFSNISANVSWLHVFLKGVFCICDIVLKIGWMPNGQKLPNMWHTYLWHCHFPKYCSSRFRQRHLCSYRPNRKQLVVCDGSGLGPRIFENFKQNSMNYLLINVAARVRQCAILTGTQTIIKTLMKSSRTQGPQLLFAPSSTASLTST